MAAPLGLFIPLFQSLIRGIGVASRYGAKSAAQQGVKYGGNLAKGFGYGLFKGASAFNVGSNAARASQKFFTDIIKNIAYQSGKTTLKASQIGSLAGLSGANLVNLGNSLSLYGGSAESYAQTMMSLTSKLTGLSFGESGFLKKAMMYTNGQFNVFGSGENGFATAQEALDEFARLGKDMDIGRFNELANLLGVDVATRKMIRDGEYDLLKNRQFMTSEDERRQKALGFQERKTAANFDKMTQLWGSRMAPFLEKIEKFKGDIWDRIGSALEKRMRQSDPKLLKESANRDFDSIADILSGKMKGVWGKATAKSREDEVVQALLEQKEKGITYTNEELTELFGNYMTEEGYEVGDKDSFRDRIEGIDRMMRAYNKGNLNELNTSYTKFSGKDRFISDVVIEKERDKFKTKTGKEYQELSSIGDTSIQTSKKRAEIEKRETVSKKKVEEIALRNFKPGMSAAHYSGVVQAAQRQVALEEQDGSEVGNKVEKERQKLGAILSSAKPERRITRYRGIAIPESDTQYDARIKEWETSREDAKKKLARLDYMSMSPEARLYAIPRDEGFREAAQVGAMGNPQPSVQQTFNIGSDMRLEVSSPAIDKGQLSPQVQDKIKNDYQNMMQEFWRPLGMKMWGG